MRGSRSLTGTRISRRTVLKALGAAAAGLTPGAGRPARATAGRTPDGPPDPAARAFVYVDHAVGPAWVAGALLADSPRRPRQLLRRAKRAHLSPQALALPEVEARNAPAALQRHLFRLLAAAGGPGRQGGGGIEVCGIHASPASLASLGGQRGLAETHLVVTLLNACDLARFGEVFVYHNLPAFAGVSRRQFREALLARVERHPAARFEVYAQRAKLRDRAVTHVNEAIQAADFVTHAFFRQHAQGDPEGLRLLRPVLRGDVAADRDPGLGAFRPR
jgi:hypothetical protein